MMHMCSDADDDMNELLLVGVVAWDVISSSSASSEATVTSKLRVHRRDIISNDYGICQGHDLERLLKAAMPDHVVNNSGNGKEDNNNGLDCVDVQDMEVYDKQSHTYVSLKDPDMIHTNVTQRFGTRIQIHVTLRHHHHQQQQSTNHSTTTPTPKAIAGRYYSYDVEKGLMIANVALQVQQIENQTVGTGMNVWDGAVLLANYLEKNPKLVRPI